MSAYATTVEAATYFSERLNTDAWDDAVTGDKTKALAQATKIIDRLNFLGELADEDQDNQFPRDNDTEVPNDIKYACCEIALALLDGVDPEIEFENLSMVAQGYGNVKSTYDREIPAAHILAGVPSVTAWRYLSPYLRDPYSITLRRVN